MKNFPTSSGGIVDAVAVEAGEIRELRLQN